MKIYLVCILMVVLAVRVKAQNDFSQTITGKVYRAGTDSVIPSASVYYGGTMYGTTTDDQGNFTLTAKPQQIPVIVSCIGYYSATVNYEPGKPLIIYLKPKLTELQTVTIRADGMDRAQEIALFTHEFIGTSAFALSCTITNIDDINLSYDAKAKTLTAGCDKPIIIDNKKLGYTISYYLDEFIDTPTELTFSGNYIFTENTPLADQDKIKHNREEAYKGSRMQLIRALWHHTIRKTDFYLLNKYGFTINENLLIKDSLQQKYVSWKSKILINYHDHTTALTPLDGASFIDKYGFYNSSLQWSGYLSHQRIGDLLPYEYQSDKEPREVEVKTIASQPVITQKNSSDSVETTRNTAMPGKLEKASANPLLFEKTYLHTDRDIYAPGDTLWFKAYLINAQDNRPVNSSNNLYVDLISPEAKVLKSMLIRLDNGIGNGDMDLPDSIAAGTYRIRAYTNWMRNFGDNFIFEKTISVLSIGEVTVKKVAGKEVAVAGKDLAGKQVNKMADTASATATATIKFYPEGGSLIEGINSIVAVKAKDGQPAIGSVISSAGDTVANFSCDSLGMGMFALIPVKGQFYRALVKGVSYPIPGALSSGLALQVRHTDTIIRVVISHSEAATAKAVLKVKHAGVTVINQEFDLTSPQTVVRVADADLPEGVCAITLYDGQNRPNCERLIYIHHPQASSNLTVNTDKTDYEAKEKVSLTITSLPNTFLSIAVADAENMDMQAGNIASYLLLSSELRGNIEHAARYFDTTNVNRFKQLDQLLLTQGWRDFIWRRLEDTSIRISYATERNIVVSGKIEDEVGHKPMSGLFVALRAEANKGVKLFDGTTDAAGHFDITGLNLYGKQSISLTSTSRAGKRTGSYVMDTINRPTVRLIVKKTTHKEDTLAEASLQKKNADIKNTKLKGVTRLKEVKIRGKNNLRLNNGAILSDWGPNELFRITPKDYQYKTLSWYLLQNSKGAHQSNDPDTYGVVYAGQDTLTIKGGNVITKTKFISPQIFVNDRELYMRDHVMAETYRQQYYDMPLEKFKTIELRHMVGALHTIKPPDLNDPYSKTKIVDTELMDFYLLYVTMIDNYTADNPGFKTTNVEGYYQARTFYQPPPNAKPQLADYRSTINWEPNIKTDASGKAAVSFYNTVVPGDVRIMVQGVTGKGVPVVAVASYTIINK